VASIVADETIKRREGRLRRILGTEVSESNGTLNKISRLLEHTQNQIGIDTTFVSFIYLFPWYQDKRRRVEMDKKNRP
jgi:hypothetical protein